MTGHAEVDGAVVATTALLGAGTLAVARALTRISVDRERLVASFAGGVSLAFVLLELFVELVEGAAHDLSLRAGPEPVHTIATLILVGASVAFAANLYGERHRESWKSYGIAVFPQVLYRALVGAALDEELRTNPRAFVVFWVAMVLHLGVAEHRLDVTYPAEHKGPWRVLGAVAPLVGVAVWARTDPSMATFHVLLAIVAGATILSIFREEIPTAREVRVVAFFTGVAIFGALIQARWRL
jgi:hypothetical protein